MDVLLPRASLDAVTPASAADVVLLSRNHEGSMKKRLARSRPMAPRETLISVIEEETA
jgi:hypothetical protein